MTGKDSFQPLREPWENAMIASNLCLLFAVFLWGMPALASWPKLNHLDHRAWTVRDGAPSGINRFAEAADGTLWLAADSGLYHFDGIHFTLFQPGEGEPALPGTAVSWLCVSQDGTIWLGFWTSGDVAAIRGTHVRLYGKEWGLPGGSVVQLQQTPDGKMWLNSTGQVFYLRGDRWVNQANDHVFPAGLTGFRDIFFDSRQTEWLTDGKRLYFLPRGASEFRIWSEEMPSAVAFLQVPDGSLWVAQQDGKPSNGSVRRFADPHGNMTLGPRIAIDVARDGIISRDGAIWIGNGTHGLLQARFTPVKGSSDIEESEPPQLSSFERADGLTSNGVTTMLQDRAGNIWVGTSDGFDRFSPPMFTRFTDRPLADEVVITSCPNGEVFFGDTASPLISVNRDVSSFHGENRYFINLYCDNDNVVWITDHTGFWQYRDGSFRAVSPPTGVSAPEVRRVTGLNEHRMFTNIRRNGIWLLQDGAWTKILPPTTGFLEDHTENLWHAPEDNVIKMWTKDGDHPVAFDNSPGLGTTWVFYESRRGLVAGGLRGIALLHNGRFHQVFALDGSALAGITGILEAPNGDLWLNGARGVVRVPAHEVEAASSTPGYRMHTELFAGDRGVEGPAAQVKGMPTAVADTYGRFWFSNESVVTHIDPYLPLVGAPAPAVSITGATVDGIPQSPLNASWKYAERTLRISYFGVDMARPQDVTYRYRLEGVDRDWQAAGTRTEAVYTSLRPGNYVFDVSASNQQDVWKDAAPYSFRVTPAFYQTRWFLVLYGCLCLAVIWGSSTLRVRYISARIRERAEERTNERLRVARDLHDTLLQGVHGLLLRVEYVSRAIPDTGDARELLQGALSSAERVLNEGREKVGHLREQSQLDLGEALSNIARELNWNRNIVFEMKQVGEIRPVRPAVYEELYWIGREAIVNAFRHAQASRIEVMLCYERERLVVICRDNGKGFSVSEQAGNAKPGHWGLQGMAERVQRLRANLERLSRPGEGTEIKVEISARKAYLTTRQWRWPTRAAELS